MTSNQERNQPISKFERIKAEQSGRILRDQEVVELLVNGSATDLTSYVSWFGVGIATSSSPYVRFPTITENSFVSLSPDKKRRYLGTAASFLLSRFEPGEDYESEVGEFQRWIAGRLLAGSNKSLGKEKMVRFNNIKVLFEEALDFAGGDVDKARQALDIHTVGSDLRSGGDSYISAFFDSGKIDPRSDIAQETGEAEINSKLAELSFWVSVDRGIFNSPSNLRQLLLDIYPRSGSGLKSTILKFLADQTLFRRASPSASKEIKLFVRENEADIRKMKENIPDSSLAKEFHRLRSVILLNELFEKSKGGKILVEELILLLEVNPTFLDYVSSKELDTALDNTQDHGVALRIERLIREKKNKKEVIVTETI